MNLARLRFACLVLAFAAFGLRAGEEADNGGKDDVAMHDAADEAQEASPNRIPKFDVAKRAFAKPSAFFDRAEGGSAMRKFYAENLNTRGDRAKAARKADDMVNYPEADGPPHAFVFRPPSYDAAEAKAGYGVYVHLETNDKRFRTLPESYEKLFDEQKIFFLRPFFPEAAEGDDVMRMSVALDLLASLRDEYPGIAAKRVFVGGTEDGARLAGIMAFNFPKTFAGYLTCHGTADLPGADKIEGRRNRMIYRVGKNCGNDLPYWEIGDIRRRKGSVRLAQILFWDKENGIDDYTVNRRSFASAFLLNRENYKVFVQEWPDFAFPPPPELFENALRFLGGRKVKQEPIRMVDACFLTWKY